MTDLLKSRVIVLVIGLLLVTSHFAGCGGGGTTSSSDGGSTTDPTKLYVGSLTAATVALGAVYADDVGNSIVALRESPDSDTVKTMLVNTGDGDFMTVKTQGGFMASLTDGTTMATFSNWDWTAKTVDITLTANGETETITGVSIADYMYATSISKGWTEFFGAGWTTLSLAACPVSLALAGASIGTTIPAAIVSCSFAGTNLYKLLSGQPTLIESAITYVTAPAECAEVVTNGGTIGEQKSCAVDAGLTTVASAAGYIDANGEFQTTGGGGGNFAGSCSLVGPQGTCINYTGSGHEVEDVQAKCTATSSTYSSGACPTGDTVGQCTIEPGDTSEIVMVFYSGVYTTGMAQTTCNTMIGIWNSPYTPPS